MSTPNVIYVLEKAIYTKRENATTALEQCFTTTLSHALQRNDRIGRATFHVCSMSFEIVFMDKTVVTRQVYIYRTIEEAML